MKMHAHRLSPVQQAHPAQEDALTPEDARTIGLRIKGPDETHRVEITRALRRRRITS